MPEIIPAILTDSPVKFKELVRKIEPYAKRIHIDVADGEFVPNKTVSGYDEIKEIESAVKFDAHLMVVDPRAVLKEWLYAYADRFIVHAESQGVEESVKAVKEHGKKAGLALNPETSIEEAEKYFKEVDFVQFMTVHPGFQGAKFEESVVDKISVFRQKYPDIIIMADGGITPETAPKLLKSGVTYLVAGSYIIKSGDTEKAIKELESCTTS